MLAAATVPEVEIVVGIVGAAGVLAEVEAGGAGAVDVRAVVVAAGAADVLAAVAEVEVGTKLLCRGSAFNADLHG